MDKENKLPTVDEYIKMADDKLSEFIKTGRYKDVLLTMVNLYRYSVKNQILIMMQKEDATVVNGMSAWNYAGRSVIPGEKSIKIISPVFTKVEKEKTDEEGKVVIEEEQVLVGYKVGHVFDISQTQGREIERITCDQEIAVEHFNELKKALEQCVDGYTISYTTHIEPGCDGYCVPSEKKIVIREGMPTERTLTTLIHELAHAIAEERERIEFKGLNPSDVRQIREIEAESVAFVISTKLGLRTQDFNLAYMSTWADGDIEKFRNNLDIIRSISYKMANRLDETLYSLTKENVQESDDEENLSLKGQMAKEAQEDVLGEDENVQESVQDNNQDASKELKKTTKSKAKKKEVEQC